jgi:hypothetical protein
MIGVTVIVGAGVCATEGSRRSWLRMIAATSFVWSRGVGADEGRQSRPVVGMEDVVAGVGQQPAQHPLL